jgi:hypothetical protein
LFQIIRLSLGCSITAGFLSVGIQRAEAAVLANYDFNTGDGVSTVTEPGSTPGTFATVGFPSSTGFFAPPLSAGGGAIFGTANDMVLTPATAYFTFTITPNAGQQLFMGGSALTFDTVRAASLSVFNWVLRSSVDGFVTDFASGTTPNVSVLNPQTVTLPSDFNFQAAAVEFRFYTSDGGENGNSANLRGYFDNVVLNGTVAPVPEPVNVALAVFGLCLAGAGFGRRLYLRSQA